MFFFPRFQLKLKQEALVYNTIIGGTPGGVIFTSGSGVLSESPADFFWDDSNKRLGLGTNTPNEQLEITGNFRIAATSIIRIGASSFIHLGPNSGLGNLFVGVDAGNFTLSAGGNLGIGLSALQVLTTGSNNFGLGIAAGAQIDSGIGNVCIGTVAGITITSGNSNICIGNSANVTDAGSINRIAIGQSSICDVDNHVVLGNADSVVWKAGADDAVVLGESSRRFKGAQFVGLHVKETENHTVHKGTSPTITAGGGTGPSIVGKDEAFVVTIGTGGVATSFEVTFANEFANPPIPSVISDTDSVSFIATPLVSKITITKAAAFTAGSKIYVSCKGWE